MNIAQNCCTLLHFLSRYVITKRLHSLFVTNFAKLRRYDAIIYHHLEAHVSFSVSVQTGSITLAGIEYDTSNLIYNG